MNTRLENVNQWLMLATNIGVLAGLILVGFQIKQNTEIASAQLIAGAFESAMQQSLAIYGESPAAVIAKLHSEPESLTDEELVIVNSWVYWYFDLSSRFDILAQEGLVPEGDWDAFYRAQARNVYGLNSVTQDTWKAITKDNPEYPWIEVAEEELSRIQAPGYEYSTMLERLRRSRDNEKQKNSTRGSDVE